MPIARKYARVIPRQPAMPSLTRLILEKIGEASWVLLDSFFPAKYPEARLWRELLGLDPSYEFRRPTFAVILSQLKSEGLVEKIGRRGKWHWRLTPQGRAVLRVRGDGQPPRPDGRRRLVCFDIPERDRAKRRWLRAELLACGYRLLQKSVWIGEAPLPPAFVAELDVLELRGQVHVLGIESAGSLREG